MVRQWSATPVRTGSNPVCAFSIDIFIAGWSSLVARRAHNPKVAGSNPAPAIQKRYELKYIQFIAFFLLYKIIIKKEDLY